MDSLTEVLMMKQLVANSPNAFSFVGFNDRIKEGIHVDLFGKNILFREHAVGSWGNLLFNKIKIRLLDRF